MNLTIGTLRNGFWNYTLDGQKNGTIIYYSYEVIFEDGTYQGPFLFQPYSYSIYLPTQKFEITSFEVHNLNPLALTVDLRIGFNIVYWSDADSLSIELRNKVEKYYLLQIIPVNISQAGVNNRFEFREVVEVKNLSLVGEGKDFPFDEYFLNVEFGLFKKDIEYILKNQGIYKYFPNQTFDITFTQRPELVGNLSSYDRRIEMKCGFKRNFHNFISIVAPLSMMFILVGSSTLIGSSKHLSEKLALYTALFVFALTFSSFNVPTEYVGNNFIETSYLFASIFAGIFAFFSIIDFYLCREKNKRKYIGKHELKNFTNLNIEILGPIISAIFLIIFVTYPYVVITDTFSDKMIFMIFQFIIISFLFIGFILKILIAHIRKKQITTYQSRLSF